MTSTQGHYIQLVSRAVWSGPLAPCPLYHITNPEEEQPWALPLLLACLLKA